MSNYFIGIMILLLSGFVGMMFPKKHKISALSILVAIGSIFTLIPALIYFSGCSHNSHEALGVMGLTTAYTKASLPFVEAFTRGILCNWLVCLAIWMASSSRHVIAKIIEPTKLPI